LGVAQKWGLVSGLRQRVAKFLFNPQPLTFFQQLGQFFGESASVAFSLAFVAARGEGGKNGGKEFWPAAIWKTVGDLGGNQL
jgi:hypothetical protein